MRTLVSRRHARVHHRGPEVSVGRAEGGVDAVNLFQAVLDARAPVRPRAEDNRVVMRMPVSMALGKHHDLDDSVHGHIGGCVRGEELLVPLLQDYSEAFLRVVLRPLPSWPICVGEPNRIHAAEQACRRCLWWSTFHACNLSADLCLALTALDISGNLLHCARPLRNVKTGRCEIDKDIETHRERTRQRIPFIVVIALLLKECFARRPEYKNKYSNMFQSVLAYSNIF